MIKPSSVGDVLTVYEAAHLLQVSERTLLAQAKEGTVPHFKIGKQYRFLRSEIMSWASSHNKKNQSEE